ncbi:MAG: YggS family pyridoxal phosphate-dependent enzyme [Phycisphaerae bacterium]|nr:YggS family pyridoxal phosphate-dependent enzyme [Phycisphaerae bacterium]
MTVAANLQAVKHEIAAAAARARRSPDEITLVAVVKSALPAQIEELLLAGQTHLADNRTQQLQMHVEKFHHWREQAASKLGQPCQANITWHMIGHLQRNKVLQTLSLAHYIHSVDSLRLAEEINELAARHDEPARVMLQVNTTGEERKYGFALPAAIHLAEQIETMANLSLVGLMTMARQSDDPEESRPAFARLRELFDEIRFHKIAGPQFCHLSMGMSGDYSVAIEEGATMVRIGTALFGAGPAHAEAAPPSQGNALQ